MSNPLPVPRRVMLTTDTVGGVWQYTLEIAAGCSKAGALVEIVSMGPAPDADRYRDAEQVGAGLRHLDVPLDWMAEGEAALRDAADSLCGVADAFRPDMVHLAGACFAGLDWPAPVVATMHSCLPTWWAAMRTGPLPGGWGWYRDAVSRGLAAADMVIAPSAAYARAIEAVYGRAPHLRVVHNGRSAPAAVGTAPKQPFATAAGRFWDDAKGLQTLDAAAARMQTPLLLAGALDGPQGQECRPRHARSCGDLPETELHQIMEESAIFVSASRYEPFGLGVLEAAQRRCALVLSDIPTFRELWDGAALFVPAEDASTFAQTIDALADRPAERERLGTAARERARGYSAARMVEGTFAVYREAMAAVRPALAAGA